MRLVALDRQHPVAPHPGPDQVVADEQCKTSDGERHGQAVVVAPHHYSRHEARECREDGSDHEAEGHRPSVGLVVHGASFRRNGDELFYYSKFVIKCQVIAILSPLL